MKLDVGAAALAAGSIAILVYALCTAFCVLVPESTVVYVTTVFFHIDVSGLYRQITWGSFIASLLGWGLGTGDESYRRMDGWAEGCGFGR